MDYILKGLPPKVIIAEGILNKDSSIKEGHSRLDILLLKEEIFSSDIFILAGDILGNYVKVDVKTKNHTSYSCKIRTKLGNIKKIDFPSSYDELINLSLATDVYIIKNEDGFNTVWRLTTTDEVNLTINIGEKYYVDKDKNSSGLYKSVIIEKYSDNFFLTKDGDFYHRNQLFDSPESLSKSRHR